MSPSSIADAPLGLRTRHPLTQEWQVYRFWEQSLKTILYAGTEDASSAIRTRDQSDMSEVR
jgi:hypothetical protein